uniref:ATP synthase F0 subunit 8 n=1 Tax=Taiwanocantharis parasatoi TaxID=3112913 RepID=UPI00300176C6|nr:ATP synthase F0 subunit 8 [Taiwanocantharis parasatoi]
MPQMAPLSWLNLFIYFIIMFMIYNSLNYFFFNKPISQDLKKKILKNKMIWKW